MKVQIADYELSQTFKSNIRTARLNAGYTQKSAAEAAMIETSMISKYERGLKMPGSINLYRLCYVYGVSMDSIFVKQEEKDERENSISCI